MKKPNCVWLISTLLLLLSLTLTLSSCREPSSGDLSLDFSADKSILPTSVAITWIQISGTRNDNPNISFPDQNFQLGNPMKITDLSVGTWTINVVGFGGNPTEGFPALTSVSTDSNVVIQSGKTTTAAFVLQYLTTGIGSCNLTVAWPESLTSFAKVEAVINDTRLEGTITGSSATMTGNLEVGDYPVDIVFTNFLGTQISFPFMEMVNVYNSLTSTGTIPFEEADFTQVATPTISNVDTIGGQLVSISSATNDSTICYTTDGTDPTTSGTKTHYTAPFTITTTKSIKAVAIKNGMVNSTETSKEVRVSQVETPVISPESISFSVSQQVTISCNTSDATIYYTTDGSEPTTASFPYSSPFTISATTTVKAIAIKSGMSNSVMASKVYAPYMIGSTGPAGGKIFYVNPNSETDGWKYLEAAPTDEASLYVYQEYGTMIVATGTKIGTGQANSNAIVAVVGTTTSYAAKACADKVIAGYDDWFLPSKAELNQMYINKATIGGFIDTWYWSSSETNTYNAWVQNFGSGDPYENVKNGSCRVRPIRAFL